ncbi:MAG: hypothetical protein IT223_12055 [Crocinitomicaceae bacterium]|nr:hypothetical protein [Crocinitomicaceae bacterium]
MKIRILTSFISLIVCGNIFSQGVGINAGSGAPDNSAGLDINFSDKGLLIPRVNLSSTTDVTVITSPATYLTVFNTNASMVNGCGVGMYYWDGNAWVFMTTSSNGAGTSGQVLTSQGAGTAPVWTAPSSGSTFGGQGTDGDLTITGITTIDLAGQAYVVKNYNSISITGSGQLKFSNPNANGTVIILKSKQNVTITSTANPSIDLRLMGAQPGTGGATNNGGTPGTQGLIGTGAVTISGSSNGGGGGGNCGSGGNTSNYQLSFYSVPISASKSIRIACGSGGGGGGGGAAGPGGNGGAGGGALYIECGGSLNFTGSINASGSDGGAGIASTTYPSGGGGGGGAGTVLLLYNNLAANTGTVVNTGGNGGARGTSSGSNCASAGGGGGSSAGGNAGSGAAAYCGCSGCAAGAGGGGGGGGGNGTSANTSCSSAIGTGGASGYVIAKNTDF